MVVTMSKTRAERAAALEQWAERVDSDELVAADTEALRVIAELAEQREGVDAAIVEAVRSARAAHRSWSEIGAMLGVSKQAAQRKYAKLISA
jgi:hypothetical protein